MAPNCKRPAWTPAEMTALVMLYEAGWRWGAIAAHVSGIHGNPRTYRACQSRGEYLGILKPERQGFVPSTAYDEDIHDMMLLDLSSYEMAEELSRQYGRPFTQMWVYSRIKLASPPLLVSWRKRAGGRMSRCVSKGRSKGKAA